MRGTKKSYIVISAIAMTILSIYTANAQVKRTPVYQNTNLVTARGQSYIETNNEAIALLAIKELGIKRYSKDKLGVLRLSYKQVDSNVVFNWINSLDTLKIALRRK